MSKKKYYVVWKGKEPGIYSSWDDCLKQVSGFKNALYKSFPTEEAAKEAFAVKGEKIVFGTQKNNTAAKTPLHKSGHPVQDSIVVDAAWNSVQKDMEYQGILYKTGKRIFHLGPLANGTNNIGEFLAIVHALGYCKKHHLPNMPVYSDSRTAISWVRSKKCKTNLDDSPKTKHIFELIKRAEFWLENNEYSNPVLKWETSVWGENPADFGRK